MLLSCTGTALFANVVFFVSFGDCNKVSKSYFINVNEKKFVNFYFDNFILPFFLSLDSASDH